VFGSRTVAIALLALVGVGCGLDDSSSGVRAVEIETTALATEPAPVSGNAPLTSNDVAALPAEEISVVPLNGPPPLPRSVAVVGDSLALSASAEITAALLEVGLVDVVIDSVESRRIIRRAVDIPPGIDAIRELQADSAPEMWVIALGTNDVASQLSIDVIRSDIAELLMLIPADAPIVWVDVWLRDHIQQAVDANAEIRRLVDQRPLSAVVNWYAWGFKDGVIRSDGVHLTERGQGVYADEIARAVDALFAS
jgi:hypothetical protein